MTATVRPSALMDVCPICLTTGASQYQRCVYCGAWFVCPHCGLRFTMDQVTSARFCPECGQQVERSAAASTVQSPLPAVAVQPVDAPVTSDVGGVTDILTARLAAEPAASTDETGVRAAQLQLADVLALHERHVEALAVLDDALAEPGLPGDVAVQLRRALALIRVGDEVGAARATLAVAAADPDEYVDLLLTLTTEISATSARSLESQLSTVWGDQAKVTRRSKPATRSAIHGMRAGAALARGLLDLAISELGKAAADDPDAARDLWLRLAGRPEASAKHIEGGAAGALSFRARGFDAVGDRANAVELAQAVLAEALSADNKPEAECHLILAAAAADPRDRGYHLMEAGRLIGTRAGAGQAERSLEVLELAARADPTRTETYWYWSDQLRVAALDEGAPDLTRLRRALEVWERGRELGPCDGAWPHLVEAAICGDLSDAGEDDAQWAFRALRASCDAVRLDDGSWEAPWVTLAKASRRLGLWHTSWFADGRCIAIMGDPDEGNLSEVEELIVAAYHLRPDRLAYWLDAYERLWGTDSWSRTLRAVSEARDGRWTPARRLLRNVSANSPDGASWLYAYILSLAEDASAGEVLRSLRSESPGPATRGTNERAWLDLLAGDAEGCLAALPSQSAGEANDLDDLCDDLTLRTLALLLLGEPGEARTCFGELAPVLRPGAARDLQMELRWVANRRRGAGDEDSAAAADQLREEVSATGAHEGAADDVVLALAELDNRLAQHPDDDMGNPETAATRALISLSAGPRVIQPDEWPLLLVVDLGSALVPEDAAEMWESWALFTTLIPETRERLRSRLGFPVMGVRIRTSQQLAAHEYQSIVNGRRGPIRAVSDASPFSPGKRLSEYPSDGAPWQECLAALEDGVLANPAAVLVPHTIETLLDEWRRDAQVPAWIVDRIEPDCLVRAMVWQRLRAEVARRGRLPGWSAGLGDMVEEVVSDVVPATEPNPVSS